MSRAYCLTCNEQVHETPAGTCPQGHPVTTHDHGPEPWVGFAGDEDRQTASSAVPVRQHAADGDDRPAVPAGQSANGAVNGHAQSLGGGHGHGDPFPSAFGHRSSFATGDDVPAPPTERAPAAGAAADDLAALLADALSNAPTDERTEATPDPDGGHDDTAPTSESTPSEEPSSTDWDDLTSLAAELRLDADPRDDGPAAPAPAAFDEEAIDAANIDDLLAELTGGLASETRTPEPPAAAPPAPAAPSTPPAPIWDEPTSTTPPPPPLVSPTEATPPPPPAPSVVPDPFEGAPAPQDDVASLPLAPEPVDLWAEPAPDDSGTDPAGTSVDLTNFTARGTRVGDGGPDRTKRKRGRKR